MPATIRFNSRVREYAWLSNFHPCQLVDKEGKLWTSVEAAYVAGKTLDPTLREQIRLAPSGAAAKTIGKTLVIRPDWSRLKVPYMTLLVQQKFNIPYLADLLRATNDAVLVELAPWDSFWGTGPNGNGQNIMGSLLMVVRSRL